MTDGGTGRKERRLQRAQDDLVGLATAMHEFGEIDDDAVSAVHQAVAAATSTKQLLEQSETVKELVRQGRTAGLARPKESGWDVPLAALALLGNAYCILFLLVGGLAGGAFTVVLGGGFLAARLLRRRRPLLLSPRRQRRNRRRIANQTEKQRERVRIAAEAEVREAVARLQFRYCAGEIDLGQLEAQLAEQQERLDGAGSLLVAAEV